LTKPLLTTTDVGEEEAVGRSQNSGRCSNRGLSGLTIISGDCKPTINQNKFAYFLYLKPVTFSISEISGVKTSVS